MTLTTPRRAAALCRIFRPGPAPSAPAGLPKNSKTPLLGRSHRSKPGKAKLKRAIDLTREILQVPADYRIGIVPASDTGAIEMAFWSLLGPHPVTVLAWESFGEGWVGDIAKELKLKDVTVRRAAYGELPDLRGIDPASDIIFTWNGTTSGVRVPERRLDRRRPDRTVDLRCDLGRLRAAARLGEARCRDLLLAEGARRRSRAWHAHPVAARSRSARKLYAAVAAAEDLPHDQRRQAQ